MIKLIFSGMLLLSLSTEAQELFSMTEPASNMPSGSFAIRVDNSIMDEINSVKTNYHLIPGIRVGLTKKLMLEGNIFFSNRSSRLSREGAGLDAKYRFLSK